MASSILAAEIGERIWKLRDARGWSQAQLARRAGVVGKSVISYYELGERYPRYETLLRLADAFGVTTDYLLRGDVREIRLDADALTEEQLDAVITIIRAMQKGNRTDTTQDGE